MLMAVTTVYRIVLVHGVEALKMMSVVYVVEMIHPVLTVLAYQMVTAGQVTVDA